MKFFYLLSLPFLLLISETSAQDISMPSPTAANLGKYADQGVNLFNGKPNISIPLVSISANDLSMDVSLSYDASGVRVSEVPDWVGTGWALNAGGVITRSTKGFADELDDGYISTNTQGKLDFMRVRLPNGFTANESDDLHNGQTVAQISSDIRNRVIDAEPDIFYYNVNGMAGKFILDPDGNPGVGVPIPQSDIKIEYTIANQTVNTYSGKTITSITLTTPSGTAYTFDKLEYAMREPGSNITKFEPAKAWYLTKVSSSSGSREATLTYSAVEEIVHKFNNEEYQTNSTTGDEHYFQFLNRIYVSEIILGSKKLVFIRQSRNDAPIPTEWSSHQGIVKEKRLGSIELRNVSDNSLIKKIVLTPTYDTNNYRMFLASIHEEDASGNQLPSHTFDYNSINNLPSRFSNGIDHWGFYNGKTSYNSGKGFISEGRWFSSALGEYQFYYGADRSVDSSKTKAGVLKKITYPTGGSVSYTYEQNDYTEVIHENDVNLDVFAQSIPIQETKELIDLSEVEAESFTDVGAETVYITATLHYTCNGTYLDYDRLLIEDTVDGLNNGGYFNTNYTMEDSSPTSNMTCTDFNNEFGPINPLGYSIGTQKFTLNDGYTPINTFEFNFYEYDSQHNEGNDEAHISYEVHGQYSFLPVKRFGPGLRVSRVVVSDGNSATSNIVKEYSYQDPLDYTKSSGFMYNEPNYLKRIPDPEDITNNAKITSGLTVTTQNAFGMGEQGFAGYKNVVETLDGNGKTEVNFYSLDDLKYSISLLLEDFDEYYSDMFSNNPNVMLSLYMGKPVKSIVYDNSEIEQTQTINSVDKMYNNNLHIIKKYFAMGLDTKILGSSLVGFSQPYYITVPFLANTKVETTIYDESSSSYTVVTETEYLNSGHKNPTKVTTTNSLSSEEKITTYSYAHEEYSGMETANMKSQPYSVLVEDGSGADLSKTWTIWNNGITGASTGVWLPKEQWVWKGTGTAPSTPSTSTANKNSEFLEYDNYGNPLKISDANDSITKAYYGSNSSPFSQAGENGVNGVYLTGIQKVQGSDNCASNCGSRPGSGDDLFTEAEYDNLGRVSKVIDENEQTMSYSYDSFNRLMSTKNTNGFVVGASGYGYSAAMNGGVFSASKPNQVEQITYIDPLYTTDFSSSTGWSSVSSNSLFNYPYAGETTVRMGTSSSWDHINRAIGSSNAIIRIDFYPDNSTEGTPHIMFDSNGNRFAINYLHSTDRFRIQYKISPSSGYSYPFTFPLNAPPNQWYTIEIQKNEGDLKAWVYPKGQGRDSDNSYSKSGFSSSWSPVFQLTGNDNYFYLANLSIAKSSQTSISYLDGLGREVQTQVRGGSKVIATETLYNERGLPEVVSRPIEEDASSFPGFDSDGLLSGGNTFTPGSTIPSIAPVASHYSLYHNGVGDDDELYAYSYTQYEASPLARVEKSTLPGEDHQTVASQAVTTTYGLNTTESFTINGKTWGTNKLNKTVSKDPDGNETITYADGWGQTIVSGVNMNPTVDDILNKSTSDLVTYFEYDERGNLVRVEDPRGLATTYTYNTLGQLISKNLPDQTHPHTYKYDNKGRLRFHRDPNMDAASDHYYYTKYDDLDRPVEVGKRTSSADFSDEADINNQSFPSSSYSWYIQYSYDGNSTYTGHTPNNTNGRLTRVTYKDPNSSYSGATYYSYNSLGLVEWVIQQPPVPSSSYNRKIEYTYDELGRMTRLYFNPLSSSSDDHYFWYYYDELGRLEKVTSYGSNSESSALTEAEYTYYADGQVEQLRLGDGAQVVDYDYTIQGWLDDINDGAASGIDQFGMTLDYTNSGNISQQQWSQAAFSTGTYTYFYEYDSSNRLKKACYDTLTCSSTGDYDVTYGYDDNGNIDFISRNATGSEPDYEYDISFESGTNKADYVYVDGISGETAPVQKQLDYDANGNMIQNEVQGISSSGTGITTTTYDWRNLPTSLSANGSTITYLYDADGNRVKKKIGSTETWYVRGADGQTIAAYQGSTLLYINILAGGQIIGQIEN